MTGLICPVEGCEFGEQEKRSFNGVQSHIQAKTDDEHDWSVLMDAVVQQREETDDEGNESSGESPPDSRSSNDDENEKSGDETSETDGSDTEEEDDDMPSQEEYEKQHESGDDDRDDVDDQGDRGEATTGSSNQDGPGNENEGLDLPVPVDPTTVATLVVIGVTAWLIVRTVRTTSTSESTTGSTDLSAEPDDISKGLNDGR